MECAIKTRVFQDYLADSRFEHNFAAIDKEACAGIDLGVVRTGHMRITLRETCNKIIHATQIVVIWGEKEYEGDLIKYWTASFELKGDKGGKPWQLELHVGNWAKAMTRYHELLSRTEERIYAGQDWK